MARPIPENRFHDLIQAATAVFVEQGYRRTQIADVAVRRGRESALEAVRMTPREREVIALIAAGMSNKEIANRMNVATDTVKSHVRNVMDKLTLHTRLQIAAYAHHQDD